MTEQAAVLIKFQTCDLARELAAATAAYDSAEATAWVVPFTQAQQAYWATQVYWDQGVLIEPFNGYAADYATRRADAINNSAQSAYENCIAGGASGPSPSAAEAGFKVIVQSQLSGNAATSTNTTTATGPTTQLSIAFAPAQVLPPLDWRAFYRLGTVRMDFNFVENWLMSFPSGGGYTQPIYTTLPMRPNIHVEADNLVSIAADFIPYIDVPDGQFIEVPADLSAKFTALQSSFAFTIYRWVCLPDGQIIEMHVDWLDQTTGALSDQRATVEFPELGATCDESGTVDVYYFITAYAFDTLYKLSDPVQRVKNQYGVYDFEVPAATFGTTPPSYGPPGYLSLHESFYYQAVLKLGIVRVKYYQGGVFQYQRQFLVWNGAPFSPESLSGMTSNASYDKSTTSTNGLTVQITLSGGTTLNGTYDVPVIEDVVVNNITSGNLSVSPSSYVVNDGAIIKIAGVLKPSNVFTPYGPFVVAEPSYQATGNFLSALPDFVDFCYFNAELNYIWDSIPGLGSRLVVKVYNTHQSALGVVLDFAGYKAWVNIPANTTKYYSGAIPYTSTVPTLTAHVTKVPPDDNSQSGLAEGQLSNSVSIKVFDALGHYEYPGTSGFTPLSKVDSEESSGETLLPVETLPTNTGLQAMLWASSSIMVRVTFVRYTFIDDEYRYEQMMASGYFVVAESGVYRVMGKSGSTTTYTLQVTLGQRESLKTTLGIVDDLIKISLPHTYQSGGVLWADEFYLPDGTTVGPTQMWDAYYTTVIAPAIASGIISPSVASTNMPGIAGVYGPTITNVSFVSGVVMGALLAGGEFEVSYLQEESSLILPDQFNLGYRI